jgi:non-haem dioxygenase in morphine synthesis N-terminal
MSSDFPVIDLEPLRQPEVSAAMRLDVARQVARACEETGFVAVTGHGVPRAVIAELVAQSYAFFTLTMQILGTLGSVSTRRGSREPMPALWMTASKRPNLLASVVAPAMVERSPQTSSLSAGCGSEGVAAPALSAPVQMGARSAGNPHAACDEYA